MNNRKSELRFLLTLLTGIFILAFFIFRPFLYSLILAIIFATVFQPLQTKVLALVRKRRGIAALLSTLTVLLVVVVPVTFLGIQIFQEATDLYSSINSNGGTAEVYRIVGNAQENLNRLLPTPIDVSTNFDQYATQGLEWLLQHTGSIFSNIVDVLGGIFIFLVALYFLFKDGGRFKAAITDLSPLEDRHDEIIFDKLALATNSVVRGSVVVGIMQGILTAIGFTIFGIPNPVLWGSVAAIAALIPGVGTALVLIPAILYLYFSDQVFFAVGLLLWSLTAVGLVDNFLGPKLAEQGVRLHPFLILLSILGGISFLGPIGFLLGPLVLSLLFALLELYFVVKKEHTGQINDTD